MIAEFKSKVIQAQAEGNEAESSTKKKVVEGSANLGEDVSDNSKNSSAMTNEEENTKGTLQPSKEGKEDTDIEYNVIEDKAIVGNNTKKNDMRQEPLDKSESIIKVTSVEAEQDKKIENVSDLHKDTSVVHSIVKETSPNETVLNKDLTNDTEQLPSLSTPNRRSHQVNELEPISPTPLPETPISGATASKPTNTSKYICNYLHSILSWLRYSFCCISIIYLHTSC